MAAGRIKQTGDPRVGDSWITSVVDSVCLKLTRLRPYFVDTTVCISASKTNDISHSFLSTCFQ